MGALKTLYGLNPLVPVFAGMTLIAAATYYYTRYYTRRHAHGHSYAALSTRDREAVLPHGRSGGPGATSTSVMSGASCASVVAHLSVDGQHRWALAVYGLWAVSVVGLVAGEAYFSEYQCTTSLAYQRDLVALTVRVLTALDAHGIPYWLDFASMLAVLRRAPVRWDHDHDVSVVFPDDYPRFHALMDQAGVQLLFDASRDLLQVYPKAAGAARGGPHIDLWLWRPTADATPRGSGTTNTGEDVDVTQAYAAATGLPADSDQLWLSSADHTLKYNPRPRHEMLPPQRVWWAQGAMNVSVPAAAVKLALKSFGETWNVALYNRADCFHNFWNGRWSYAGYGDVM